QIRALSVRTLAVSMDAASYEETVRIADPEPLIVPSFGIHPWEAPRFGADLDALAAALDDAPAIGEIGLDHHFVEDEGQYGTQRAVFEFFLDAAEGSGRLVNLHTTGAEVDVLECLRGRALPAVIVHWYSGPLELVDEFLELGAYFTVGVAVLRSKRIRRLAAALPSDRLLTETDNPGGWKWMTGEVGFPELLERVEDALAEIRGVERPALAEQVGANFLRVTGAGGIAVPPP
ncbi:MAG: TatD family hydrolase, partial [Gemmatimonadetes bacterium]|nr:TatD family hydrolase [Gemmatimonadota bacterium]NIR78152.1 TatD family hydrolase [Gemmatimonadota bacterium]NIT86719.1 TatD family hydrolase [Gemmatimonadota bacterium]NIU30576.1 TatD family hydrolase [Gemmatimonadota bacterium]NIV60942.1 hypothetical protein [Gemmatimonadota bacterium]